MTLVRAEHWNNPLAVAILGEINRAAGQLGIRYCVVGATARDIVIQGVYGLPVPSATADIDFAVGVDSWEAYEQLHQALRDTGAFESGDGAQHLLRYKPGGDYPLDLIPYGGVTDEQHQLRWPPRADPVMNLIGYRETVEHALQVALSDTVIAPVASIPGFVLLKLFAWADRWATTRRDLADVAFIMRDYQRVPPVSERLYGPRIDLLEHADFDLDIASIALLGEDVRGVASEATAGALVALLRESKVRPRLLAHLDGADVLGGYQLEPEAALEWFERGLSGLEASAP